jgi:hypothetical protein
MAVTLQKVADTSALMEANEVKRSSQSPTRRFCACSRRAVRWRGTPMPKPRRSTARIVKELEPIDRKLADQIRFDHHERNHANDRHLMFESSAIGFQVGIVLAGVSIIVRRPGWLSVAPSRVSPVWW